MMLIIHAKRLGLIAVTNVDYPYIYVINILAFLPKKSLLYLDSNTKTACISSYNYLFGTILHV